MLNLNKEINFPKKEIIKLEIEISGIECDPRNKDFDLKKAAEKKSGFKLESFRILKKSIDARRKNAVKIIYRVAAIPAENCGSEKISSFKIHQENIFLEVKKTSIKKNAAVIGAGPAGLFAAVRLLQHGHNVTIYERGKPVEERAADIELLNTEGSLNTESNILFGEGGAGTWSDGKLTTRINKEDVDFVFRFLAKHGAPKEILYEAKPHIGTDCLRKVIKNIRRTILNEGAEVLYSERVESLIIRDNSVKGVISKNLGEKYYDYVIAAPGHSARDFYKELQSLGVLLLKKPFAVGFRVEHSAEFINKSQYADFRNYLPTADYRLAFNNKQTARSVYSFCMCPGGYVVNSSSEEKMLCVNGMSNFKRDAENSNSAIVTGVKETDISGDALSGIEFQRDIEKKAFSLGGDNFTAPAQQLATFCFGKKGNMLITNSLYKPGVKEADISKLFSEVYVSELKRGLKYFDKKIPGFISEGIIVGAETRTSSPVRIERDRNFESVNLENLFPAGEGAGYAGGIVSSAVDGIRAADAAVQKNL